jgi:MYXO-CTERM domain-containing protein
MRTPTRLAFASPALAFATLAAAACSSPVATEGDGSHVHVAPTAEQLRAVPDTYPALGFDPHPSYIPNNVLVLTFDDGPDWNNTATVLDVLRDKGVKASFFINTVNWSDVNMDAPMQALVRRMVDEGHELANHTVHHLHLPTLSASAIDDELSGVEETVDNVVGSDAPRLTLVRAPFGEPYQDGMGYDLVAPVVAEHGVHIGWNFDTFDYDCPMGDSNCVLTNFKNGVKTPGQGAWGIVLMHSVHSQTAAALPAIIDYARDKGFELWTVEQVVCARFNKGSANIVDGTSGGCDVQPGMPDAGPPGTPDAAPPPGTPDAAPPPPGTPDAAPEGEPDAGGNPNNGGGNMTGSCGCRVGGQGEGAPAGLLLLAPLALLAIRRRRRR